MSAPVSIWAFVPAAGSGTRMRAALPKQYLPLFGKPVLAHTLARLSSHPRVQGVWVGIAQRDTYWRDMSAGVSTSKLMGATPGGATRAETVLSGLNVIAERAGPNDWVMVHDAVRPCVRHEDIDKLIATVEGHRDGALLAVPVSDTVKRVDDRASVVETVSRDNLWRALTPQLFPFVTLREALSRAIADGVAVTDEASAVEHAGGHPMVVAGQPDNIKITLPEDLALAELLLQRQARE